MKRRLKASSVRDFSEIGRPDSACVTGSTKASGLCPRLCWRESGGGGRIGLAEGIQCSTGCEVHQLGKNAFDENNGDRRLGIPEEAQ